MITFEGMDRRMPKIEACLHQYGIWRLRGRFACSTALMWNPS